MAGVSHKKQRIKSRTKSTLSVADQLFAITTRNNPAAAELLPAARAAAVADFQVQQRAALAKLVPVTAPGLAPAGKILTGGFSATLKIFSRAAVFLLAVGTGILLVQHFADESISIEDELGKSALYNEFGTEEKSVSLHVMRRRKKIGEFTVAQGSKLRVDKASNGDAFRSEVAFAGTEADFKLKYKGKASVIVKNGPFKAKVHIPHGSDNDVHLRFKELGTPMPVGEPRFSIEVIKGNVQIAEVDDDDDFEHYKEGEKAIFSLGDSESL